MWDRLKSLSLAKLMVELTAALALMVLGAFVGFVAFDQWRHWTDRDHAEDQRIKRDFLCFQQRGTPPDSFDALLQLQFEVETLMDSARQQLAPTDFVGKLRKLGLCAEFSGISAGGLQFADPAKSLQDRQRLTAFDRGGDNPVQRRLAEIETLARVVPGFPVEIHDQASEKLREMLVLYEDIAQGGLVEPVIIDAPDGPDPDPDPGPVVAEPAPAETWLLVVGADQSDAAAADQVAQTSRVLEQAGLSGAVPAPEIYLVRSWRRIVLPFDSRDAAQAALDALGARLPYGGYLRDAATWCADLNADWPAAIGDIPVTRCEL